VNLVDPKEHLKIKEDLQEAIKSIDS